MLHPMFPPFITPFSIAKPLPNQPRADKIKTEKGRGGYCWMIDALVFAFAMFCGWVVFDTVKHRRLSLEIVMSALVVAVIAGIGWLLLDLIF